MMQFPYRDWHLIVQLPCYLKIILTKKKYHDLDFLMYSIT